jgi:membrane protein DedA with SNARE-associated domain
MKEKGWRGQVVIIAYSLLPLPTTPLFVAGGMAKISALYIIPAFFVGKFTSDTITVHLGKYASEHAQSVMEGALSWKSVASLAVGLLLICALLFIDWRSLIQKKRLQLNFKIWK